VVQLCRFTELRTVGRPAAFTYFLIDGQAPRGFIPDCDNELFDPDNLGVRPLGQIWVIGRGNEILLSFAHEADARQVLRVLKEHQFDRLYHVGPPGPACLTFPVRTR
jgi:hypothetical protein